MQDSGHVIPDGVVGQTALVEAASVEATGTVLAVEGKVLVVGCDRAPWADGEVRDAVVNVFAADALYRLSGPASASGTTVVTGAGAVLERINRRQWPRRRLDLAVTLCPVADGARVEGVPGRTVDISAGGACVETLRPVEGEGDPMVILSLPDGTSIVSGTTTVMVEDLGDGWRYRLAFRDLDHHDMGRLLELTA